MLRANRRFPGCPRREVIRRPERNELRGVWGSSAPGRNMRLVSNEIDDSPSFDPPPLGETPDVRARLRLQFFLRPQPGPKDLLVSHHRTPWAILPQTPVYCLDSTSLLVCHRTKEDQTNEKYLSTYVTTSFGPVSKSSSYSLGDPPPDPHFLASLGALPSVAPSLP
jgi:hypothetical protein